MILVGYNRCGISVPVPDEHYAYCTFCNLYTLMSVATKYLLMPVQYFGMLPVFWNFSHYIAAMFLLVNFRFAKLPSTLCS